MEYNPSNKKLIKTKIALISVLTVLALPFFWHPMEPWRTVVAIGTDISDGDHSFLTRVGGSYEIEAFATYFSRIIIPPPIVACAQDKKQKNREASHVS